MNQYAVNGATQPLALYQYPDTLAHSKPLFNLLLPFSPGENRTLFLTGTLAQPDTLFVTDKLPYHPFADSSIGLRFVNLSPGSAPVIVRINGLSSNPVTGSLPFKGITGFMNVPATAATGSYVVEFYDQATNTLLGNYTLGNVGATTGNNSWRYFNFTLALQGLPGVTSGATAQSVFLIRHYFSF
jgi:hypothetical protein